MSAFPVGLQFGFELTTAIQAVARAVSRSSGLDAAVRQSGSDPTTEDQLTALLGRNRLDPVFCEGFRHLTRPASQTPLSRFLKDLVLEDGAGPTLKRALDSDNPGLLAAAAQLSFLAWFYDRQSLGQALVQVVEEELIQKGLIPTLGLNYAALLGTIKACQDQTATFPWEDYFTNVEGKINQELKNPSPGNTFETSGRLRKRRRISESTRHVRAQALLLYAEERAIPFAVLRALLVALADLQRFPEEHVLEIACHEGMSSIVIWCHYILNISIRVIIDDVQIQFGTEPYRVLVTRCSNGSEVKAVLMKASQDIVPVFTLVSAETDPYLETDRRIPAHGFLKVVLLDHGLTQKKVLKIARLLLRDCLVGISLQQSQPDHTSAGSNKLKVVRSANSILSTELTSSVAFLFDLDLGELQAQGKDAVGPLPQYNHVSWIAFHKLIYTFARVPDRNDCKLFPISTASFESSSWTQLKKKVPLEDPILCFENLCRMLRGQGYHLERLDNVFLMSDRGWSVFLSSIDAKDPAEFDYGVLQIKPGVPARHGVRKSRIIDGMVVDNVINYLGETGLRYDEDGICFLPGISTAKLIGSFIGLDEHDAFAVTQTYEWTYGYRNKRPYRWKSGFRDKQHLAQGYDVLQECSCDSNSYSEEKVKGDIEKLSLPDPQPRGERPGQWPLRYPKGDVQASRTPERIFTLERGGIWVFFVTEGGAARWTVVNSILLFKGPVWGKCKQYIRGSRCCVRCALEFVMSVKPEAMLVL